MRILLLCYEYPPIGGGGGVGAKKYAESWARKGHDVTVLTSRTEGLEDREKVAGVHVVRVRTFGKEQRATSTVLSMLTYLLSGLAHLVRNRGDYRDVQVVNTHFSLPTGPLGWAASRLLAVPDVLTIIGGDIYDPSKDRSPHRHRSLRAVNRFLIRAAKDVVAISTDTEARAREHYDIRRPIRVINYGFSPPDEDQIEQVRLPSSRDDRYYLIAIGRLVRRKGFGYLIEAVRRLPEDVELLLIGDGPLEDRLRSEARRRGVEERIHLLGYQSSPRVYGYLLQADCFVLSSLHEGLGIVVQEAMWAGLPIVATNNGGQVDLVEDGRNGILVRPGDTTGLTEAVLSLYENPGIAARMAEANRSDIRDYHVDSNSEQYLDRFRTLAHRGDGRTGPSSRA